MSWKKGEGLRVDGEGEGAVKGKCEFTMTGQRAAWVGKVEKTAA